MNKKKQQMLGNLEIAAFCDQLSMIVSAGIPIYEGISILQEDAPEEETAEILSVISNSLDHGSSFCDALRETNVFPKYVLDMIGIGELAGKLEEVLNALTGYYKREESIQNSIKNFNRIIHFCSMETFRTVFKSNISFYILCKFFKKFCSVNGYLFNLLF